MNEILSRWASANIRRRDGSLPVWDVGWPGFLARQRRQRREAVAACRRELLGALLRGPGPMFLMHEPPAEHGVPGDWQAASEATWIVPPDFDLNHPAVAYWLFALGDWRCYKAPTPVA